MHTETKYTAIPARIKAAVAKRDNGTCIICGASGFSNAHIVRRSQGGRGDTERNIVTLCGPCHYAHDEGIYMSRLRPLGFETQQDVERFVVEYINGFYPGWTPENVKYHKLEK